MLYIKYCNFSFSQILTVFESIQWKGIPHLFQPYEYSREEKHIIAKQLPISIYDKGQCILEFLHCTEYN